MTYARTQLRAAWPTGLNQCRFSRAGAPSLRQASGRQPRACGGKTLSDEESALAASGMAALRVNVGEPVASIMFVGLSARLRAAI
jgi:hypothetical protein